MTNKINNLLQVKITEFKNHYLFKDKDIKFLLKNTIKLSIFPEPIININDIEIKNVQYKNHIYNFIIKKIVVNIDYIEFIKGNIKATNITINGITVNGIENNLPDYYIRKDLVKKIVKLDTNEVIGIKDKLKNLFIYNTNNIQEGYKEIEEVEETKVYLDNKLISNMLIELFKSIKTNNIIFDNNIRIEILNANAFIFKDQKNIQKEIKNISGNILIKNYLEAKFKFNLNNINGILSFNNKKKDKNNNRILSINISNDLKDNITLNYIGNNIFVNDIKNINGDLKLTFITKNLNNFIQCFLSSNSKFYYLFDYKNAINFSLNIIKNSDSYYFKNIRVNGEDISINGNINYLDNFSNIDFNIEKLNFDYFLINTKKYKFKNDLNEIDIFKYNTIEDLINNIKNKNNKITKYNNSQVNIKIGNIIKNGKLIKDSNINFFVNDGIFKINSLYINFNNTIIQTEGNIVINDFIVNKIKIIGKDFNDIINVFNAGKIIDIKDFELTSNMFIHNDKIYFIDYYLNNNKNKINGSVEYSLDNENYYIACKADIDNLEIEYNDKQDKTLKEKILWLNNFDSNIFLDLQINNLKFKNISNIFFKGKIKYNLGYFNIYNIENLTLDNLKNAKGNLLITIEKSRPIIILNLYADIFRYNLELSKYIFDIEKYRNILTKEKIDEKNQSKFWINKLFSIPTWEEIYGEINLKFKDLQINNAILNNFDFMAKIENGNLNIDKFKFFGFDGSTELKGNIDFKNTKKFNLILTETIYDIEKILQLFKENISSSLKGSIGVGGIIRGSGFTPNMFANSLDIQFKFIGKDLLINGFGLHDLKNILSKSEIKNIDNLKNLDLKNIILKSKNGTYFNKYSGSFVMKNGISTLNLQADGDSISSKLNSIIDNSNKDTIINIGNISLLQVRLGEKKIPLYFTIDFKEDFSNEANLIVNTDQITEYVNSVINGLSN